MTYLPGLEHDLFVSYAREDVAWVNELREQLVERLRDRLGCDSSVWQDTNKICTGQKWPDQLRNAIQSCAAFVAVLSRNYTGSEWCEKELDTFAVLPPRKGGSKPAVSAAS